VRHESRRWSQFWSRTATATGGPTCCGPVTGVPPSRGEAEVVSLAFDGERVPVHNLSIPLTPTYYVGEGGLWAHSRDYRKIFKEAYEESTGKAFPADYQVHHRIPQEHRDLFPDGEVDRLDNWVGVPRGRGTPTTWRAGINPCHRRLL